MSILFRALLLSAVLFSVTACTSKPVLNIQQAAPASSVRSEADMRRAIVSALNKRGWLVQQSDKQLVLAEITVRSQFHAQIAIPYSASQFAIQYRDSSGLNYNNGKIHRNYNRWVANLRNSVLQELQSNSLGLQ